MDENEGVPGVPDDDPATPPGDLATPPGFKTLIQTIVNVVQDPNGQVSVNIKSTSQEGLEIMQSLLAGTDVVMQKMLRARTAEKMDSPEGRAKGVRLWVPGGE